MKYILFALGFFAQMSLCAESLETLLERALARDIGRTVYGYSVIISQCKYGGERKVLREEKKEFEKLYNHLREKDSSLPKISLYEYQKSSCEALAVNIHKQLKKAKN